MFLVFGMLEFVPGLSPAEMFGGGPSIVAQCIVFVAVGLVVAATVLSA